jgi:phage shock protein A
MTFDDFEKWVRRMEERHEALSQSLEILTHDVHELQAGIKEQKARIDSLASIAETALASITALAKIAESHERRITDLEGGE